MSTKKFEAPKGLPTVFDPSYVGVGQKVGLDIWRVEKLKVVKKSLDDKSHKGGLHTGDAYIILQTKKRNAALERHIFFWLGTESSQDEQGVAAYKTVELDESLGGEPVQHRECQGHETDEFISLFPTGLTYHEGGVATGFKHVDRNAFETRLLHVKGRRKIRTQVIPLEPSKMNEGDVFILDAGRDIFQWNGKECSKLEKQKGMDVARSIRDEERSGNARVHIIESGKDDDKLFWEKFGKAKPGRIADASAGGDDEKHAQRAAEMIKLYKMSDASGKLEVTEIEEKPYKKEVLDTSDAYILDTGPAGIYAWVGKGASQTEKLHVMKYACDFISQKGYPAHTPVTRVVEGGETPLFKENFVWPENLILPGQGLPRRKSFQKKTFDTNTMHQRAEREKAKLVDDGQGVLEIWRIEDFEMAEYPKSSYGDLYTGDSFVMLYTYEDAQGKKKYLIYFWQGHKSSQDERGASAIQAKDLDDKYGGEPVQVRVVQGKEPPHLLLVFKKYGGLIIHEGGKASGFKNRDDKDSFDTDGTRLYQVKGTSKENMRAVQVVERAASLNSGDVFILETPKDLFIWCGKACSGDEREAAKSIIGRIKNGETSMIVEGQEPESFWSSLGGKEAYAEASETATEYHDPRLFQCSDARGYFFVEEVFDFDQADLIEEDVMILDTYEEVFIWIGKDAKPNEKKDALETALKYIDGDKSGRTSEDTCIMQIKQGFEPPNFTCHFAGWDPEKWSSGKTYEELKAELLAAGGSAAAAAELGQSATDALKVFSMDRELPYETLIKPVDQLPEGIDPLRREQYLSEADFKKYFNMTKAEFNGVPKWKANNLKKKVKLF